MSQYDPLTCVREPGGRGDQIRKQGPYISKSCPSDGPRRVVLGSHALHTAVHARFAEADLASILDHHRAATMSGPTHRAGEDGSLTQGTSAWAALGASSTHPPQHDAPSRHEQEAAQ